MADAEHDGEGQEVNRLLIGPNKTMKRRMKAISQCEGAQLLRVGSVGGDGGLTRVV